MNCPKCSGQVYLDEGELVCRNCGARWYPPEPEPPKAPKPKRNRKPYDPTTRKWRYKPCDDCQTPIPINGPEPKRCPPCRKVHLRRLRKEWEDRHCTPRLCLECQHPISKGSTARRHPDCHKAHIAELHRGYQQEVREGQRFWKVRWYGYRQSV